MPKTMDQKRYEAACRIMDYYKPEQGYVGLPYQIRSILKDTVRKISDSSRIQFLTKYNLPLT